VAFRDGSHRCRAPLSRNGSAIAPRSRVLPPKRQDSVRANSRHSIRTTYYLAELSTRRASIYSSFQIVTAIPAARPASAELSMRASRMRTCPGGGGGAAPPGVALPAQSRRYIGRNFCQSSIGASRGGHSFSSLSPITYIFDHCHWRRSSAVGYTCPPSLSVSCAASSHIRLQHAHKITDGARPLKGLKEWARPRYQRVVWRWISTRPRTGEGMISGLAKAPSQTAMAAGVSS